MSEVPQGHARVVAIILGYEKPAVRAEAEKGHGPRQSTQADFFTLLVQAADHNLAACPNAGHPFSAVVEGRRAFPRLQRPALANAEVCQGHARDGLVAQVEGGPNLRGVGKCLEALETASSLPAPAARAGLVQVGLPELVRCIPPRLLGLLEM